MGYFQNLIAKATAAPGPERRSWSIGDPALAEFLGIGAKSAAGETVTEARALGLTALYRAVSLIAGTVASLPMKSYRRLGDGGRERVPSFLDTPGGPDGLTPFEWRELAMTHLLLHGNAYGLHRTNGAGAVIGLQLLHPLAVTVESKDGTPAGKVFTVRLADGTSRTFTPRELTHVTALSSDGLVGVSPLRAARDSIGTALAGERAAGRMFASGFLISGLVTTLEDVEEDEAKAIKASLSAKAGGAAHAGDIAFVNRNLKFDKWSMSAEDAQFLESRAFQVEEIARLYGVPKALLQEDGASTWGSGIAELIRGFARFTLAPWTSRLEERLSALLGGERFVEFDYAGLLQPTETEATANLIAEVEAGLLTIDEARALKNRPAITTTPDPEVLV